MSKLKVQDMKGAARGEIEVADDLLVLRGGEQAVHDAVVAHLAAKRAGSASTLRKGEVAGSNRKPWRQKGTGMARAGYRRSPIWRGGGVAFGPHPRSYDKKVSKKTRRLAFSRVLSDKIASGAVRVVENLDLPEPKTRLLAAALKALGAAAPAVLVLEKSDPKIVLAARNMPGVEVVAADSLDTYRLLRYPVVVATKGAIDCLSARLRRSA